MGLNILGISNIATLKSDPVAYEFEGLMDSDAMDAHPSPDFMGHSMEYADTPEAILVYKTQNSKELTVNMGSYSNYNKFRNQICLVANGVIDVEAWDNPKKYESAPAWDLINFSDCEGIIDSIMSKKILDGLVEIQERFINHIEKEDSIGKMDKEEFIKDYAELIEVFKLGSEEGIVIFL